MDENKINQAQYLSNDLSKAQIVQRVKLVPDPLSPTGVVAVLQAVATEDYLYLIATNYQRTSKL